MKITCEACKTKNLDEHYKGTRVCDCKNEATLFYGRCVPIDALTGMIVYVARCEYHKLFPSAYTTSFWIVSKDEYLIAKIMEE